jgi:hypothetical protein
MAGSLKDNILALAKMQRELRNALNEKMKAENLGFTEVAHRTKLGWNEIKNFAENNSSLLSERKLVAVCTFVNRQDLIANTLKLSTSIADRYKAFTILEDEAIIICFELIDKFNLCKNVPGHLFAKAFGIDEAAVAGAITGKVENCKAFNSADVRNRVSQLLKPGNFETALEYSIRDFAIKYDRNGSNIRQLWQEITKICGSVAIAASTLKISRSSVQNCSTDAMRLYKANRQLSSYEQQEKLIDQMTKWLDAHKSSGINPTGPDDSQANARSLDNADLNNFEDLVKLLKMAGETSSDGVMFSLTEDSFSEIAKVPIIALRESLLVVIPIARALLNIGSQFDDEIGREILQEALGRELRELYHSIKAFSTAHPNEITSLIDSQRALLQKGKQAR